MKAVYENNHESILSPQSMINNNSSAWKQNMKREKSLIKVDSFSHVKQTYREKANYFWQFNDFHKTQFGIVV